MERLLRELRLASRALMRAPSFALTATMTLALGIGLSTAVFTVAYEVLLRPLQINDQDRVVVLWGETRDGRFTNFPLALDQAREFARRTRSLEKTGFFAYEGAWPKPVRDRDRSFRLRRALVSGSFFEVLQTKPELGRALRSEDDVLGAAPVVVISHSAWLHQFAGDSTVIGRTIVMHETGRAFTIVGVIPSGLDYPKGAEFWAPLVPSCTDAGADSLHLTSPTLDVVGRLRHGATLADARTEMTGFFARKEVPESVLDVRGVAHTLPEVILGDTKPALIILALAAALLLLITCTNVANLLLVRGLGRLKEIVVRTALGAGRWHIVSQLLVESLVLCVAGGVLGAAVATVAVRGFVLFAPAGVARLDEIGVSAKLLFGAAGITALAMMLFAIVPALITSRVELQDVLRSGSRQSGSSRTFHLATEALVAGQVALAAVVLVAAALLANSLIRLQRLDLSFDPSRVMTAELALPYDRFEGKDKQLALLDLLLTRVAALPGVEAVSPVLAVPFSGTGGISGHLATPSQTPEEINSNPMLTLEIAAPNYFATLGVPVLRGRPFLDTDKRGAPSVVIISESAARHYWPAADPIGKTLTTGDPKEGLLTVVGVVPDVRYREIRDARPTVYFPLRQSFFPVMPMTLIIRTRSSAAALTNVLRRTIVEVDPGVALAGVTPVDEFLQQAHAEPRLDALLLCIFAATALSLAALGLFGVIATMVRERTLELAIRKAVGATDARVRMLVIMRGMVIAAAGGVVGIAVALSLSRLLSVLLFQVTPTDAPTLAIVTVLIFAVTATATFIAARSSIRIEPALALRGDA